MLGSELVAAIALLLERRAAAADGVGWLAERKDLEPVSVAALQAVYPGRAEKSRKVSIPGWERVGQVDLVLRESPGAPTLSAVAELKWCGPGHDILFEAIWDAFKMALATQREDHPQSYLLTGAPLSMWAHSDFADLFEDGEHHPDVLCGRRLNNKARSLAWDELLAGGYDHYPVEVPAVIRTVVCGRAKVGKWELRAAEVSVSGTEMVPMAAGWPHGRRPADARHPPSDASAAAATSAVGEVPAVSVRDRFMGCLLAGAVGDALGAPIEFASLEEIRQRFGESGVSEMVDGTWPAGSITDDTQLTLFTAEGLLRGDVRGRQRGVSSPPSVVAGAYSRWAYIQGIPLTQTISGKAWEGFEPDGWLITVPELFARRAPGATCLSSLSGDRAGSIEEPLNDSKGCGGLMRAAPAGLMPVPWGDEGQSDTFGRGAAIAAITHGHPSGYLAAGFLALMIERLRLGDRLEPALDLSTTRLARESGHQEVAAAIRAARQLASEGASNIERLEQLGEGWVAEEALSIAIYATVSTASLADALLLAINHSGDSDSAGAITGSLAGTLYGSDAIPSRWLNTLELRSVIQQIAEDLYRCSEDPNWDPDQEATRYPGW